MGASGCRLRRLFWSTFGVCARLLFDAGRPAQLTTSCNTIATTRADGGFSLLGGNVLGGSVLAVSCVLINHSLFIIIRPGQADNPHPCRP